MDIFDMGKNGEEAATITRDLSLQTVSPENPDHCPCWAVQPPHAMPGAACTHL